MAEVNWRGSTRESAKPPQPILLGHSSEPDILIIQFDDNSAHRVIVCNFPFYILNSFVRTRFLETEIDFTWVYPPEVPKSAAIIILACFFCWKSLITCRNAKKKSKFCWKKSCKIFFFSNNFFLGGGGNHLKHVEMQKKKHSNIFFLNGCHSGHIGFWTKSKI